MRNIVIFATFFLSFNLYAKSFLIYNAPKKLQLKLKTEYGASEVFTQKEKQLLAASNVISNVLKVELDESSLKTVKSLSAGHKNVKIESNPNQTFFSTEPYEDLQWGLQNRGKDLIEWESDIDVVSTSGLIGEDVGAFTLKEDPSKRIRVAVIDSGIDVEHPDLKDQILRKEDECVNLKRYQECLATNPDRASCHESFAKEDADGNGYPMDCSGWNLSDTDIPGASVNGGPNIQDRDGHGTHVAGIIGAKRNKSGTVGVTQNVEIIPVQVGVRSSSSSAQEAPTDKIAKGILYAIVSGAQVINLSLGWRFDQDSVLMRQMIEHALEKDVLVVAAAGNDAHDGPVYPCSYEGVICVASHSVNGELSSFSNYGAHVDIAAPGTKILSSWPAGIRSRIFTQEDAYEYLSGTSQAAPHVSGVLARLLNLGNTPSQALVKLLKGSRPFKNSSGKLIRNGKADFALAAKQIESSFIYPVNKSPALVKWEEGASQRSFILKLENLGLKTKNVSLTIESLNKAKGIELITKNLHLGDLDSKERIQERIYFTAPYEGAGEFLFKVKIKSDQEDKSYLVQAKAISLVDPDSVRSDKTLFPIVSDDELSNTSLNLFEDQTNSSSIDLLALRANANDTSVSLLRQTQDVYHKSPWVKLPVKNPVILNLSKVDLEGDSSPEYVITLVNLEDRKKRETKFFAFDQDFKIKRVLIAPKNTYDNQLAVLPGKFKWALHNERMVPAWIGVGERPESQRPVAGPWDVPEPELKINRLYLLTPEGVTTQEFPGDEEMPLHILYQSPSSKSKGEIHIVSGDSFGYHKNYATYRYKDGLQKLNGFKLSPYMDLLNTKPLPMANPLGDHAFFSENTMGNARIVGISVENSKVKIDQKLASSFSPEERIQRVLSFDGKTEIYQTRHHLGSGTSRVPSKVGLSRIMHDILGSRAGLYLRSAFSPGLGSEVIAIDNSGVVSRPAKWFTLGVNDCAETGLVSEGAQDTLVFVCPTSAKVIHFKL